MAVNEDGEIVGAVSRRLRRGRRGRDRRPGAAPAASRSSCTSGSPTRRRGTSAFRAAARSTSGSRSTSRAGSPRSRSAGGRAAEVTLIEGGETPGTKLLFDDGPAQSGTLGSPELDDQARRAAEERPVGRDVGAPAARVRRRRRSRAAADHVRRRSDFAAALCTLARAAGWRPFVVDPRRRFAHPRAVPGRRGGARGVARRGIRAARRDRPGDLDRGPHPRPEARRRGAA